MYIQVDLTRRYNAVLYGLRYVNDNEHTLHTPIHRKGMIAQVRIAFG